MNKHKYFRFLDKLRKEGKNMYHIQKEFDKEFPELDAMNSRAIQYDYLVSRRI